MKHPGRSVVQPPPVTAVHPWTKPTSLRYRCTLVSHEKHPIPSVIQPPLENVVHPRAQAQETAVRVHPGVSRETSGSVSCPATTRDSRLSSGPNPGDCGSGASGVSRETSESISYPAPTCDGCSPAHPASGDCGARAPIGGSPDTSDLTLSVPHSLGVLRWVWTCEFERRPVSTIDAARISVASGTLCARAT